MGEISCSRFVGKTALVTGGGSGFGAGIARRLAAEGARVAVVDINLNAAEEVAKSLGNGSLAFEANVATDSQVGKMAASLLREFGRLDVLVNNAGVGHSPQPLEGVSEELFDKIFSVNAKSVFLTSRHFVPAMKSSGGGAIRRVDRRGPTTSGPYLVQCLEGLDDRGDARDGDRARAVGDPGQRN